MRALTNELRAPFRSDLQRGGDDLAQALDAVADGLLVGVGEVQAHGLSLIHIYIRQSSEVTVNYYEASLLDNMAAMPAYARPSTISVSSASSSPVSTSAYNPRSVSYTHLSPWTTTRPPARCMRRWAASAT